MIPVFNRTDHLKQCLESVLAAGLPVSNMQIAVVDDSTDNPSVEETVKAIGNDRVEYFHNSTNLGMTGNWSRCVALARGELVHILHDDDYVAQEFYERMGTLAGRYPAASIYFCRALEVDAGGSVTGITPRLKELEACGNDPGALLYRCEVRFPAVVARKEAYQRVGPFRSDLHMIPDWEMWLRLIANTGGVSLDAPLVYYRWHDTNASHRLLRDGTYFREMFAIRSWLGDTFPSFQHKVYDGKLAANLYECLRSAKARGDTAFETANFPHWKEMLPWHRRVRYAVKSLCQELSRLMRV